MELDPTKLQLIFNVGMITGVTSLAVICRLLKRDNQKLSVELKQRNERRVVHTEIMRRKAVPSPWEPEHSANLLGAPDRAAVRKAPPEVRQDIRQYVAQRAQSWMVSPATRTS
jgi:hypothetical protein